MDELSDRAEEILEQLWVLIAEQHVQPAPEVLRDDEAFGSLREMGLVRLDDKTVMLTQKGRKEAEACVRRHRLAERLLVDILDTADDEMHRMGCKLEHSLHRGLEERVCTILGHPRACPHGKPIPPGDCCRRLDREVEPLLSTAADLPTDEPAVIAYLNSRDPADLRKLMAIAALPGTSIVVRQRFPSYLVELGSAQFGIDEHMARQIHVRRAAPGRRRRRRGGPG